MNALESDYRQLLQLAARRRDRREHALTLFQRDVVQLQTGLLERQKLRFVRQRLGPDDHLGVSHLQKIRRMLRGVLESLDRAVCLSPPLCTLAVEAHAVRVVVELREDVEIRGRKGTCARTHVFCVTGRDGAS